MTSTNNEDNLCSWLRDVRYARTSPTSNNPVRFQQPSIRYECHCNLYAQHTGNYILLINCKIPHLK